MSSASQTGPHSLPAPSVWTIVLLGSLSGLGPLSVDLYLPSLPSLARGFGEPPAQAALTVVCFLLGLSVGQLVYGPLSDRLGRKIPLLSGLALYTAASLGCALSGSLWGLIAFRLLQGLGACAGIVISRAVVRDRWQGHEIARVLSLLMLVMGLAPLLAPLAGGALLLVTGWRTIFWILASVGVTTMLAVIVALPESRPEAVASRARSELPLISYRRLLSEGPFVRYMIAAAFSQAFLHTYIASSPDLFINSYGVSAQDYGWIFGANGIALTGGAQLNHRLLRRYGPSKVLRGANLFGFVAGLVMIGNAVTGLGGMFGILVPLFLMIGSLGFASPNAIACALSVDPDRAGSAAALVGAGQFGAGAACGALAQLFYDGTALPMAAVMAGAMLIVLAVLRLVGKPSDQALPTGE